MALDELHGAPLDGEYSDWLVHATFVGQAL